MNIYAQRSLFLEQVTYYNFMLPFLTDSSRMNIINSTCFMSTVNANMHLTNIFQNCNVSMLSVNLYRVPISKPYNVGSNNRAAIHACIIIELKLFPHDSILCAYISFMQQMLKP